MTKKLTFAIALCLSIFLWCLCALGSPNENSKPKAIAKASSQTIFNVYDLKGQEKEINTVHSPVLMFSWW